MKFVTIYNTIHTSEMAIIRNLFEEHGIDFLMPDMATDSATGIAALGINGMRVQVPEEQREKAIALLHDRGFS